MITVKTWKELVTFDPIRDGKLDVDGTIRLIATVKDKTVEEIEENTPIDELLPLFLACVHEANDLVFAKINTMPKNGKGDSTEM
jgi:hypothetical protein